ncbi:GldG family protein [bacterium]|nr:GldG family protein [candidate division CSSED10-310 bacterium]
MAKRHIVQSSTQSVTLIILLMGILFFINILSYRLFMRADLTEKKEYTVSESTRNVLKSLGDIVNVTAYFSQDLPPYHAGIRTQVEDLLSEYAAYSEGNLNIEFVDPSADEELKARLARMGIPEVPLGEIKRDKQVISMGFMGIAIQYGDNGEVIPFIRNISNLEYDLTAALLKVKDKTEKIIIWVGESKTDQQDPEGHYFLHEELNKTFVVRPMAPAQVTVIPKRTSLVIVDGSSDLPDRALYAIDQYLMQDGKVIVLTDRVTLNPDQGLSAASTDQSIHGLLESYGISIAKELVADRSNAMAMFNSGMVRFRLPYPFWPKIGRLGFSPDNPAVNQLESLVLPWTSPLSITGQVDGRTVVPLVETSEVSWVTREPFDLNPQQKWDITEDDLRKSILAYDLTGRFISYFSGKPIPKDPSAPLTAGEEEETEEEIDSSTDQGRLIVVASTRFITNQFLSLHPENMMFLQNIVDHLAIGNDLIGIRSRQVTDRPLSFGTTDEKAVESKKTFHRVMGTVMIPILIVFFGLARTAMRKQAKKQREQGSKETHHE